MKETSFFEGYKIAVGYGDEVGLDLANGVGQDELRVGDGWFCDGKQQIELAFKFAILTEIVGGDVDVGDFNRRQALPITASSLRRMESETIGMVE